MLKIWAKTYKDDKIIKDLLYTKSAKYDTGKFIDYLVDICYEFDIQTPIVLKSHKFNFTKFNCTRFKACDFLEEVNFDSLVLENASE